MSSTLLICINTTMNLLLVVFVFVGQALAATVMPSTMKPHVTHQHHHHGTHPTREPIVTEAFAFRYDPHVHLMVAIVKHKCYIYTMAGTETTDVHTTHGLRLLETKLITMVDDTSMTYQTMSHDEVMAASKYFARVCNRDKFSAYKLN